MSSKLRSIDRAFRMRRSRDPLGFSLVELLTVIGLIALMTSLLIPATASLRGSHDRKRAVNLIMNMIEQARVAALKSGERVHVIFAKAKVSIHGEDAVIVIGDGPLLGSQNPGPVVYTRWIKLPQGVRIFSAADTLGSSAVSDTTLLQALPASPTESELSCVTFTPSGGVEYPPDPHLQIALYEGIRQSGREQATGAGARSTQNLGENGLYDIVSLTRFTGRSHYYSAQLQ
jgi:type II secretory pathway pseudopilin PulG